MLRTTYLHFFPLAQMRKFIHRSLACRYSLCRLETYLEVGVAEPLYITFLKSCSKFAYGFSAVLLIT